MKPYPKRKSVLDEREMQELYLIEHRGLWLVYALLCAATVVQLLCGAPFAQMAGEILVIGLSSVALIVAYVRHGIWDENARPSARGNAAYAALSAIAVALMVWGRRGGAVKALAVGACAFILCFALLGALMAFVQRGQRKRDQALEDEEMNE